MPLSVEIKINGRLLSVVSIARLEALQGADAEHQYRAREEWHADRPPRQQSAPFTHRYSDGEQVCAAKALAALHDL